MKKWLQNRIVTRVLGVAVLVVLCGIVYKVLEPRIALSQAIDDLRDGRSDAREKLRQREDRGEVIAALKEALDEEGTVRGKIEILTTLETFHETRPVRRALDSPSVSTRRAAAFRSHGGDAALDERIRPIVLEWIRDEGADSRDLAALLCDRLRIQDAVPTLLAILDRPGKTPEAHALLRNSLYALTNLKPEGLGPKALAIAGNTDLDPQIRGGAFDVVGRLEDAPQADVQALMLAMIKDRTPRNNLLRNKATGVLQRNRFANEEVWTALKDVLFDDQERDGPGTPQEKGLRWVVQRGCLRALGRTYPLDRMEELLLDRRVYRHPFHGIRVDVATAITALRMQKRICLEILADYLVDEDAGDPQMLVRQEAWLTLWTLTGLSDGVSKPELFQQLPAALPDEASKRDFLFSSHHQRSGVTADQVKVVREYTSDLGRMKTLREKLQNLMGEIEAQWAKPK